MIPFLDLRAVNDAHRAAIDHAIAAVLDSGQTILGPQTSAFETEFAQYCGSGNAVGVGNGLDALSLIIRALGLSRGALMIAVGPAERKPVLGRSYDAASLGYAPLGSPRPRIGM